MDEDGAYQNLAALINNPPDEDTYLIEVLPSGEGNNYTYGDFRRHVAAVSRGLRNAGYDRGDVIGIVGGNSANFLISYFAVMNAGMVAAPINYKLSKRVIAHIITDAEIRAVLAAAEYYQDFENLVQTHPYDDDGFGSLYDAGEFTTEVMRPEDIGTILYTSGSTGFPKGVPLTHGGYLWASKVHPARHNLNDARVLVAAPLYHMNALFQSKIIPRYGQTMVMLRQFDPRLYIEAIDKFACTNLTSVPTMLAMVLREDDALAKGDFSSVRNVAAASAPSTEAMFDRLSKLFPSAVVANGYGTTESGPIAFGGHPDGLLRPTLSLGHPIPEVTVRLKGGANDDIGEMQIKNGCLFPEYLNRPEETAKKYDDGWYCTGDVMRRDENGFYFFVGRDDDMFPCGGENIYPGEVEALLETHPEIMQAAVVPVDDELKYKLPVAFVVKKLGSDLSEADVRRYALDNAPSYAHPRAVWFKDEIPLASTNKIDKKTLLEAAAAAFDRQAVSQNV
jgi:acyl-CoA synthetase (AMP-forming)/AMP-acid ligase II